MSAKPSVGRALMRSLLRVAHQRPLKVTPKLSPSRVGTGRFLSQADRDAGPVLRRYLPFLEEELVQGIEGPEIYPTQLCQLIGTVFRKRNQPKNTEELRGWVSDGFAALRMLHRLRTMENIGSDRCTNGVRVEAVANSYGRVGPGQADTMYVYRIRITNMRDEPVQILARSWEITDTAAGKVHTTGEMDGIVGKRPTIRPGDTFEYHSSALVGEGGSMEGMYLTSDLRHVEIGRFILDPSVPVDVDGN